MEVKEIEISKEEITKELNELKEALEKGYISKKNPMIQDLLKVYGHLELGGTIIDIVKAFSESGLDDNYDPKLAIVRADARNCFLYKYSNGGGLFSRGRKEQYSVSYSKTFGDVKLPSGTFQWTDLDSENRFRQTIAPLIPPRVNLAISTKIVPQYYHIIFEPETWHKYTPIPPKDPILGKMLTENLFGVLATWELTDLEAKILEKYAVKR